MDLYGISHYTESDNYSQNSITTSQSSSGSSYNPNAVVYSASSSDTSLGRNIYSLDGDSTVQFISEAEQENSWSDLFINGLKNIEDSDLSKEITHWNELFQKILDMPESEEKFKRLAEVANDFVYCADTFGKIIISELHTPLEQKTIKPVDIGGVAGGLKFKIKDIMFKFVIDTEIREGVWMYGDDKRADGFAQKSANHEIKGLNHFMEISNGGLIRFPLMAIIDYRGYRLLAISQLPIDKTTIVYGSCDAGKTVYNSDPLIFKEMERISQILNLRGHTAGLTQTFIYGPGDIEVHKGTDGRYYMIDFARIFPPEYPLVFQNQKDKIGREIFYHMLRPELVKRSTKPLSSDAFSGWQTSLFEDDLNRDVVRVTKFLHAENIELAVTTLNAKDEINYSPSSHKIEEIIKIVNILHSQGINNRYLGVICSQLTVRCIKELLLSDVVARVWKRLVRSKLRRIMDITRRPSEAPYKVLIAEVFALILKKDPEQIEFWSSIERGSFKYIALQVFPRCLSESDMNSDYDLRQILDTKVIILRLIQMLNIKVNNSSLNQFLSTGNYILGLQDIEEVGSTVKYPYIIDFCHGCELLYQTQQIIKAPNPNPLELERWIDNAKHKLYEAIRQMPSSFKVLLKLMTAFHIKASVATDVRETIQILIIGIITSGWNLREEIHEYPILYGLIGLFHLNIATSYLFHSSFIEQFEKELGLAKVQLEKALGEDPNCLEDYIYQTLPLSTTVVPLVFEKQEESYQKRKVYQLLTLTYLLMNTPKESVLHVHFQKYLSSIIQIDNFEILSNAELVMDTNVITQFFLNSQQLLSISIRKLIFTREISTAISQLSKLTSLGLSDISFNTGKGDEKPDELNFNLFFKSVFNNCPQLATLAMVCSKNINDTTFDGLHHHFSKLKCLEFNKTMITDSTITKLAEIKSTENLISLTLSNSKEFTDDAVCKILETIPNLEHLNLDHLSKVTDCTAHYIVSYQLNLKSLSLVSPGYSRDCILEISEQLNHLKSFSKPDFKIPHNYKINKVNIDDKLRSSLLMYYIQMSAILRNNLEIFFYDSFCMRSSSNNEPFLLLFLNTGYYNKVLNMNNGNNNNKFRVFPNFIISQIVKYLLDDDQLSTQYKLSLLFISSDILEFVRNGNFYSFFNANNLDEEELSMHLNNKLCAMKSLRYLILYVSQLCTPLLPYCSQVETIKLFIDTDYNDLAIGHQLFPNLRKLIVQYSFDEFGFYGDLSQVSALKILINNDHFNISCIKPLLEKVKPSITKLSMWGCSLTTGDPLKDMFLDYKPPNLKYLSYSDISTPMSEQYLTSQSNNLTSLSIYDTINNYCNVIDICKNLYSLSLSTFDINYLNHVNMNPSIKKLQLRIVEPMLKWDEFKYVQQLIINTDRKTINSMLLCNLNPQSSLRYLDSTTSSKAFQWALDKFMTSNQLLHKLLFNVDLCKVTNKYCTSLSKVISKHCSLTTLSIVLYYDDSNACKERAEHLFSHLHESISLKTINIETYCGNIPPKKTFFQKVINYIKIEKDINPLPSLKPPFVIQEYTETFRKYIRIDDESNFKKNKIK
ncbi:hypothetical protein DLAC_03666 [Tieghemostelium lacteum]|uniref:Clu domain-containing protein n=1 Tax=Tieghemostelium lacteum TaxID=361077 RepID=A0A152A0T1_TIELA|nr:hypothetical protein DLAC_03666 [Tieghemostelium lacteum]|eukprot:KYQ99726.1 hypothetical protein DLAC_03666 [Tieghemostelium lacteum]